jgi:glucosamine--fructose-6-phosphate aminotransferase (isomerizing)
MTQDDIRKITSVMTEQIPAVIRKALGLSDSIRKIAAKLVDCEHVFYIGRDVDSSSCTEASLKLKEISYIHSEAYAAGELKHGTISLITDGTPVIALTTISKVCEKTVSGIREVKSRGAYVISVCSESLAEEFDIPCDEQILIPEIDELLMPFPAATVLQLLAYHVSALKGLDVDKPRNLAKSVTVE